MQEFRVEEKQSDKYVNAFLVEGTVQTKTRRNSGMRRGGKLKCVDSPGKQGSWGWHSESVEESELL